jgi:hypothetical protein
MALIFDMSVLNDYVEKNKFKLEGWEEMFNYAVTANYGIKFDLKKFYHEIDINAEHKKIFWIYVSNGGRKAPHLFCMGHNAIWLY